jgi:biopolymer transport protein ExbB/TolQ
MQTCKVALLQLLVSIIVIAALILFNFDFLHEFYIANQETMVGIIINSFIVVLFIAGLLSIIRALGYYAAQEKALRLFRKNLTRDLDEPDEGVGQHTIIVQRYHRLQELNRTNTAVDQNALAAALVAQESLKTSFPRFVNNILILAGVFGTIIALSIALLGADDMLTDTGAVSGMGTVIHGMSTALSTTMTAIFCYVFFHFFYSKLTDIQTNILSQIEDVTQTQLVARHAVTESDVLRNANQMLNVLQSLITEMKETQQEYTHVGKQLVALITASQQDTTGMNTHFDKLEHLLREGFRLPDQQ